MRFWRWSLSAMFLILDGCSTRSGNNVEPTRPRQRRIRHSEHESSFIDPPDRRRPKRRRQQYVTTDDNSYSDSSSSSDLYDSDHSSRLQPLKARGRPVSTHVRARGTSPRPSFESPKLVPIPSDRNESEARRPDAASNIQTTTERATYPETVAVINQSETSSEAPEMSTLANIPPPPPPLPQSFDFLSKANARLVPDPIPESQGPSSSAPKSRPPFAIGAQELKEKRGKLRKFR
jgi:hypothetical protein